MSPSVNRILVAACIVFAGSTTGCATGVRAAITLQTGGALGTLPAYQGVRADIQSVSDNLAPPASPVKLINGIFSATDLPLSAVADSLLLPARAVYLATGKAHGSVLPSEERIVAPQERAEAAARDREMRRLQQLHLQSALRTGEMRPLVEGEPQMPSDSAAQDAERHPDPTTKGRP
ncbi:MAG: YceK/YidQ family lipoprotein [Planctomycetaceae bacterium]|nr:YceK/YidQ family lipoprotein [Planctomycetaceae bacterium]